MRNKNKLLITDMLSVFGSGLSDVAVLTMAFLITGSAEKTTYIISIRLLSSVLVFFIMPKMLTKLSMRKFSISTDLVRATSCLIVITTWNIYFVATFAVIISFCTGVNSALKTVAYQSFVNSDERMKFISKQQFLHNSLSLLSPVASAIIINYYELKAVFAVECLCFVASAVISCRVDSWGTEMKEGRNRMLSGFAYIFSDKIQRNILFFRLSILTSMIAYQILSTYILTSDYKKILKLLDTDMLKSYPDVIATFSVVATLSLLAGSLLSGKWFRIETIKMSFVSGAVLISLGCMFWAVPVGDFAVPGYITGTLLIFLGLSLLRISLYTSGQELTDKDKFSEIIVTSDMVSRTYQSVLGFIILTAVSFTTPKGMFLIFSLASLGSVFFSSAIYKSFIINKVNE